MPFFRYDEKCEGCFSIENNFEQCKDHMNPVPDDNCNECQKLIKMATDFQTHKHTFTCEKKKKRITIKSSEGHGRFDAISRGHKISQAVLCRFNFPQFPLHKTTFILGMPKNIDNEESARRKSDLTKIKKFLIRLTQEDNNETNTKNEDFKSWTFLTFLFEAGMFDKFRRKVEDYSDEEKKHALSRYLNALSASVRGSGSVFLQRTTSDIFTNNFNRRLLSVHEANHDIQIVIDQVCCMKKT